MSQPPLTAASALRELRRHASAEDAAQLQRYFKTGPGEYAAGDRFIGVRVPATRRVARAFRGLSLEHCAALLGSKYHEARLLALLLLVDAYARGDATARARIFDLYLASTHRVDNWDLVDSSAPYIVGRHLYGGDTTPLTALARSPSVWERRIAMLATSHFIRAGSFHETLRIAELLVNDRHDLIHKAVGWMLREVGERDRAAEERFLRRHARTMPRTMLRYAIEKFEPALRQAYLRGQVAEG